MDRSLTAGRGRGWLFLILMLALVPGGSLAGHAAWSPNALIDTSLGHPDNEGDRLPIPYALPPASASADDFLDIIAEATFTYLSSEWATTHHLPWSWRSDLASDGDYANTAEIGFYALSWIAAYDLQRAWSPSWRATEAEVTAVLDQLRAWQTGSQSEQPHGPNAYQNSVFYQWYWIGRTPPVVGADVGLNQLVPAVDNAWLAASLITIREYANANGHPGLAQKAAAILGDMDFRLWYDADAHLFYWGEVQNPYGGHIADYYSGENRIINFVARAMGHLTAAEFRASLEVLEQPAITYREITVEKTNWDGAYFTYASPALFIREMNTAYGERTLTPATRAQVVYAHQQNYDAWGFSDCYAVGMGGYVRQGAPPVAMPDPPETRPGLVTAHVSGMALITPWASEAIANLQTISDTFPCAYDATYGFYDAVMADPSAPDYGQCSDRFSALAQQWLFLGLVNHQSGFVWDYFYRDSGVLRAHVDMVGESPVYLPLIVRTYAGVPD